MGIISGSSALSGTFVTMRIAPTGSTRGTFDVALIGAGGAGVTFIHALATIMAVRQTRTIRVLMCDDVDRLGDPVDDRTWSFWDHEPNLADPAVTSSWQRLRVCLPGRDRVLALVEHQYKMLRSADYYRLVAQAVAAVGPRLDVVRVPKARAVQARDTEVVVTTGLGEHRARWALDARRRGALTDPVLWQHFTGIYIRTHSDYFDPTTATLMDFRTRQPVNGLSFVYVLPMDERTALVEYTEFTKEVASSAYRRAELSRYLRQTMDRSGFVELGDEEGSIPMTGAAPPQARGRIIPVGTAGGATRGSTGYTFRAMQRGGEHFAQQVLTGGKLTVPQYYPDRHRTLDSILLHGIARGTVSGPECLERLFASVPADVLLKFLDGRTSVRQDGQILAAAPKFPLTCAALRRIARAGVSDR